MLSGLDLEIAPGEMIALVGVNGAGKTTLTKLLTGLYQPTGGRITVDGTPLRDLASRAWRDRITVVFQDFVQYELSLRDNVVLGAPNREADEALLADVARQAGITDLVTGTCRGWDTPLSRVFSGGTDLSGGQWQRVALARALYAAACGARLLVLDEPTAHLDVRAEIDVFSRVAAQAGEAGVVLISHRLSAVRKADRIVFLDGGVVTESGSHDELIALGGSYARMYALQADRFAEASEPDDAHQPGPVERTLRR
ncbi:ATP-binding cassette domain-containing protein [Streptomyces sp. 8N706]|uniref:ATP-binding cassette domain-containing protein n=1 Tax=Streptomyces sp. 8N706 TaxID=3457416 RepID=UPI003FD5F170